MPSFPIAASLALCIAGAASAGPTWTLETEPASSGGFIAYGVVIARNDINGVTGQGVADAVDAFSSPFLLGDDVLDFGGAMSVSASDGGAGAGVAGTLDMFTTVDGDSSPLVTARLGAFGGVQRTGALESHVSMDPNSRAVFAVRVNDAAADRPVHIVVSWLYAVVADAPASTTTDASLNANVRMGREGDAFLAQSIAAIFADEADLPLAQAGEHRLTLAPDDLSRAVLLHARSQSLAAFDGVPGVPGPLDAGAFDAEFTVSISLRQFCPGDTDGDDLVNFADLNTVVGSFNAVGPVGAHAGDINGDGVVDFADLNMTLTNFGQTGC